MVGARLEPSDEDPLPWSDLAGANAVYFTAGDEGALRQARAADVLVATSRVFPLLARSGVELDALVGSALDPSETFDASLLEPAPRLVVWTRGAEGGTFIERGGPERRYDPAPVPGPIVDRYGAGDSFAAGLAYALGAGEPAAAALAFGARCGAAVIAGRGPYEGQLRLDPGTA